MLILTESGSRGTLRPSILIRFSVRRACLKKAGAGGERAAVAAQSETELLLLSDLASVLVVAAEHGPGFRHLGNPQRSGATGRSRKLAWLKPGVRACTPGRCS